MKFMKKNENLLTKNYRYVNAPRDKTVKATRLKILDCIGKYISELFKKSHLNRKPGSQVISIPNKHIFTRWRANSIAPTVSLCQAEVQLDTLFWIVAVLPRKSCIKQQFYRYYLKK